MLAGAMLILTGVTAVALYSLKPSRRVRDFSERKVLIGWGLVFPVVTLSALMIYAFMRGESLLARPDAGTLTLGAHSRQWSWTFSYPGGKQSENVLHVPAGRTFHVLISSEDVIHSFWVPRLGGKMDAIPGRVNRIALTAEAPGLYRGICAEYCGIRHAHMPFIVQAHAPEDYAAALAEGAGSRPDGGLPILERRRSPAGDALRNGAEHVLRWLGIKE